MATQWYSISPRLVPDGPRAGSFAVFADRDGPPEHFAPVPREATNALRDVQWTEGTTEFEVAAKLGVLGRFSGSASARTRLYTREATAWVESHRAATDPHHVIGTRWGVGFRIVVTVTGFDADISLNFGIISAAVKLGAASASYALEGFGISGRQVLAQLPGPGRFDDDTIRKLDDAKDALANWVAVDSAEAVRRSVPFQVELRDPPAGGGAAESQSVFYAMRLLARGFRLRRALRRGESNQLDVDMIRQTYTHVRKAVDESLPIDSMWDPTNAEEAFAAEWLERTEPPEAS